jgi:probable HAF family extracellular repeat protein
LGILRYAIFNMTLIMVAGGAARLHFSRLDRPNIVVDSPPEIRISGHIPSFPKYTIQDIGALPEGTRSAGVKVNSGGDVTGVADDEDGIDHAFQWQNGKMLDLGNLGGKLTHATSINDAGQIVGTTQADDGNNILSSHPFLWKNGKMTDLQPRNGEEIRWTPLDINNVGQITGFADIQFKGMHAVIWSKDKFTDIGTLGGVSSIGCAINDKGQVVGRYQRGPAEPQQRAFLYDRISGAKDLGTLGTGKESEALAVNNQGDVVGWSLIAEPAPNTDLSSHAFLWSKGKMTDLGTLGGKNSSASSINDKGQIVGTAEDGEGALRGFIWQDGEGVSLDSLLPPNSGWMITPPQESPYSLGRLYVNKQGQITGCAMHNGMLRAFLMTPRAN